MEARIRLENGSKVFQGWDKRISEVERRTTPRPVSVIKVSLAVLGVFCTMSGALWMLSNTIRDRPTTEQLRRITKDNGAAHEAAGHGALREDVNSIKQSQGAQRQLIKDVQTKQGAQGKKLDVLLDRVRPRRR